MSGGRQEEQVCLKSNLSDLSSEVDTLAMKLAAATESLDEASVGLDKEKAHSERELLENSKLRVESNQTVSRITQLHYLRLGVPPEQVEFDINRAPPFRDVVMSLISFQEAQVVLCRKVRDMGLRAGFLIKRAIEGQFSSSVLHTHPVFSRIKGVLEHKDGVVRPATVLFLVFASCEDAKRVFDMAGKSESGACALRVEDPWLGTSHEITMEPFYQKDFLKAGENSK